MIPRVLKGLEALNDPSEMIALGFFFVGSYYVLAAIFIHYDLKAGYTGPWRRNGTLDSVTSVLWSLAAVILILSLLDLVRRNELTLRQLLWYYILFLFLFAFVYNILDWHFPGMVDGRNSGWRGELQCLSMSIQTMTTGDYTSAKPGKPIVELLSSLQLLLGVLFVAVFIAKAVAVLTTPGVIRPYP